MSSSNPDDGDAYVKLSYITASIVIFFGCCCCCSRLLWKRNRRIEQNEQRRSPSMVYSVTMQGGGVNSFHNSVTEFLRSERTHEADLEPTNRQMQHNNNLLTPQGLPSYDDVISGKVEGHVEPPPPYRRNELDCNLDR